MDAAQIRRDGKRVIFNRCLIPRYPANVIIPLATTLASVPASVDSSPPLYVPRDSLEDMA